MIDSLIMTEQTFYMHSLTSLSVDEIDAEVCKQVY